jgi:hypothetical protein
VLFEFSEIEALVLEKAAKTVLEYDEHELKEEQDNDQKRMWRAEINDLKAVLLKFKKQLG